MARHRALTSTFRSVIALFTALVVAVIGATALPTAALAGGNGHAKGHQSDRAGKGSDRSAKPGKAHTAHKPGHQKSQKPAKPAHQKSQKPAKPAHQKSQKPAKPASQKSHKPAKPGHQKSATPGHQKSAKPGQQKSGGKGDKGGKGGKGDPPGNNGTVKIAHLNENDGTPNNNPHVGCSFQIEWYGFDKGDDIISTVSFAAHSPTGDVSISGTSPEKVFVGGDSASGAGTETGLDGVQKYTLSFDGEPHPKQGYHVKLTVHTPYSQGSDRKHKVFWVEPCEEDNEVPDDEEADDDDEADEDDENDDEADEDEADDDNGVQDEVNDTEQTRAEVRNVQASRGSQGSAAAPSAEVPTAVDSGLTDEEWSRSVLPFLAVLLGLATSFVALMRRRARVQAVSSD